MPENLSTYCFYSDLPSPLAYMENDSNVVTLSYLQVNRIIEVAWEDRTPFDTIKLQFGLNESEVETLMKRELEFRSYILWRKRVEACKTKHVKTRSHNTSRFKSTSQRAISLNKISKRK